MAKIINGILNILKFILLFISFGLTFYIIMYMYQRLDKDFFDTLEIFVPYLLLFILMAINHIFGQKQVTSNLFYNFTCCFVFVVLIIVGYRAIFDDYMIMRSKMGYDINFNYFADIVAPLKSMIYLLLAADICFIFSKENVALIDSSNDSVVAKELDKMEVKVSVKKSSAKKKTAGRSTDNTSK